MRLTFSLLACLAFSPHASAATLYSNDFETNDLSGWSISSGTIGIASAPNSSTNFLGLFARDVQTTFMLSGLPTGDTVILEFELYINNSWDGNNTSFGPDIFTAEVVGGPVLLNTTFSNTYFAGFEQSYPSAWNPGTPVGYAPGTGSIAVNTRGYGDGDSTYRLNFSILVTDPTMSFRFSGLNLQDATDENWGIDNFNVSTSTTAVPEPSSGVILLLGLSFLALRRKR